MLFTMKKYAPLLRFLSYAAWGVLLFGATLSIRSFADWGANFYALGVRAGQVAVIVYMLTLIPGIITRMRLNISILRKINGWLVPIRRQLGILTFTLAIVHESFTTLVPQVAVGGRPSFALLEPHHWAGIAAVSLMFPLWLTSNDYAVRTLGKRWKQLHRLTYLALLAVFTHVALLGTNWAFFVGTFVVLEGVSWVRWYRFSRSLEENKEAPA